MEHPCLRCGACCAFFRVAFHWSEAEAFLGGKVPPELTEKLDPHRLAMRGTNAAQPRCVALQGTVGEAVLRAAVEHLGAEALSISRRGVREGAILARLHAGDAWLDAATAGRGWEM
jgi:hypothetical protein